MEDKNDIYPILNDEKYMLRYNMMFAFIISAILIVFMGVFGYIVGYKVGRDSIFETTVATEAIEPTIATTDCSEPTAQVEPTVYNVDRLDIECCHKAPSAPVTTETIPVVDPDELEMLACVIYQEAGGNGSCDDCRRYVADIVLNRIAHPEFPNTMEEVLTAQGQYGMFHYTGIKWSERSKHDTEKEAVARAYRIAEEVLSGKHSKLYGEGYIWQARFVQGTEGFWCCGHFYGR